MRIHVLQHAAYEGPAGIATWAERAGHSLTTHRLFQGDKLPRLEDVDVVVAMGGPMSANDDARCRWMKPEKQFLDQAIHKHKKVLGICLGAQLLAQVLGARVYPHREKEIGWYPIDVNLPNIRQTALSVLPQGIDVFHWHGETFDLPAGALHLARSRACENQAFACGNHVIGLQFHIEVVMDDIECWLRQAPGDLNGGGAFVMDPEEILDLTPSKVPPVHAAMVRFLEGFTGSRGGVHA